MSRRPSALLLLPVGLALLPVPCGAAGARAERPVPLVSREGAFGSRLVLREAAEVPLARAAAGPALPLDVSLRGLSLASADFDRDGVPDVVAGHGGSEGGVLAFHRGSPSGILPLAATGAEAFPEPPHLVRVAVAPAFLAAGDFDGDGLPDVAFAGRGADALQLASGDGRGGIRGIRAVRLGGALTSLAAGDVNRPDGLPDLVVGVSTPTGAELVVFESPGGALGGAPERIPLPAPAAALAVAQLDADAFVDVAVAAGPEIIVVGGRDRGPSAVGAPATSPTLGRVALLPRACVALAAGDFAGDGRTELAALDEEGTLHVVGSGPAADGSRRPPLSFGGAVRPGANASPLLVAARSSSLGFADLVVADPAEPSLLVVNAGGTEPLAAPVAAGGTVAAVLPMRLNADALSDLVVLPRDAASLSIFLTAAASSFTVNDPGDKGDPDFGDGVCDSDKSVAGAQCTLRAAIELANWNPGADAITIAVPTVTVTYGFGLPSITDVVTIEGGRNEVTATNGGTAFEVQAGSSAIRNVVVNKFTYGVVFRTKGNNVVEGCLLGTDKAGTAKKGNGDGGIRIREGASDNTIGGTSAAARNVVSGNGSSQIRIEDGASGTRILGNYIGTDVTGSAALGSGAYGVRVYDGPGTVIGGTGAGAGNVISGNGNPGIDFSKGSVLVQGNLIGTNAAGTAKLGNGSFGVYVNGAGATIGGTVAAARNVISGTVSTAGQFNGDGVVVHGEGTVVQGNRVGTDAAGTADLGNDRAGISVGSSSGGSVVGGIAAGAGNVVAFNKRTGVEIAFAKKVPIRGNSIHDNGGLGIDLGLEGVDKNDIPDYDGDPNYPVLIQEASGTVRGTLDARASTKFTVDFYANTACDPSGHGEAQTWVAAKEVTTDAEGRASFDVPYGDNLTATAIDPDGNTSELSACLSNCIVPPARPGARAPDACVPPPELTALDASVGITGTTFRAKVTGRFLGKDATLTFFDAAGGVDPEVTATVLSASGTTQLDADVTVSPLARLGPHSVRAKVGSVESADLKDALQVFETWVEVHQGAVLDPSVTLLANHSTVVRSYGRGGPSSLITDVTGLLYVTRGGVQVSGSPFAPNPPARTTLKTSFDVRGEKNPYLDEERFYLLDSLDFFFGNLGRQNPTPPGFASGDYELYLAVSQTSPRSLPPRVEGATLPELKARRDFMLVDWAKTVRFATSAPFRVLIADDPRVAGGVPLRQIHAGAAEQEDFLRAAFPLDPTQVSFLTIPGKGLIDVDSCKAIRLTDEWGTKVNACLSTFLRVRNQFAADSGEPVYDRLVLESDRATAGALLAGGTGLANSATFDTAIVTTENPGTLAHELGHTLGLGDTSCGFGCSTFLMNTFHTCYAMKVNCRRSDAIVETDFTGNRVEAGAVRLLPMSAWPGKPPVPASASVAASGPLAGRSVSLQRLDLMGITNLDDDRWPDLVDWNALRAKLAPRSARPLAAGETVTASGLVAVDDAVTLLDVAHGSLVPPAMEPGDYAVDLLDAAGKTLASTSFAVSYRRSGGPGSQTSFAVGVPYSAAARKLQVRRGEKVLASRTLSTSRPTVQLLAPQAGQSVSGPTEVRWSATDPDGDSLTYSLLYLPDGKTPLPVAFGLGGTSFTWDPGAYAGGSSARIAVVASDGFNTGSAVSPAFTVTRKPPEVGFLAPTDNAAYPAGSDVVLNAAGFDAEDGPLPAKAFSFRSDRDGSLGSGATLAARLTEGSHTLTVRGVDADGNASEASIKVTVGPAADVPVVSTLTPASGTPGTSVTIGGKALSGATVRFGSVDAPVQSGSATQVVVTVPSSLPAGTANVTVTARGYTAPPVRFEVLASGPRIASISPSGAPVGSTVFLKGSLFAADTPGNVVRFGSTQATVIDGGTTESLGVRVPAGLSPGSVDVTVTTSRGTSLPFPFTVTSGAPVGAVTLTAVTPSTAERGATVTITGSGFSSTPDRDGITFGPARATPSSATPSSLVVVVPSDAPSGAVDLAVTVDGYPSNVLLFTVGSAPGAPDIRVLPSSLDFGKVATGSSRDLTVTVSNPGTGSLTVTSLSVAGASFRAVSPPSPFSVAGGGQQAVAVRFAPASAGTQTGTLTLSHNVPGKLAVTVPLAGEGTAAGPVTTVFVPVVLSSAGANGSYFTSELTLTNRGTTDATVELAFTALDGDGNGTGVDRLGAGKQKTVSDAIAYLRTLGVPIPDTGGRVGTLLVRFTGLSAPDAGAAMVRTTTLVPPGMPATGRAGLAYAGLPDAGLLTGTAWLCGLRQDLKDRSNVAIMNAGASSAGNVTLRLTVFSGDPAAPQAVTFTDETLAPGGFKQLSGILGSNGLAISNGYVKVERVSGSAPFYTYGVINDQATSDGSFVPPLVPSTLAGKAGLTIPVAVEAGPFTTELVVANLGTSQRTVQLTYVASAITTTDHAATVSLTLMPREQRVIPGFVELLRSLGIAGVGPAGATFTGPVFLTSGSDVADLFAGARTSSAGDGGRYGLFYTAVPTGSAATGSVWLSGLLQDGENRTNLALVNTGESSSSPSSFRVELFDGATGSLTNVVQDVTVPAKGFFQIGTILATYAPSTTNAYARVTRASGASPFIAYAVVNDGAGPGQRSGDGAFVAMEKGTDAPPPSPTLVLSPASLDFGSVQVGQTHTVSLTVGNAGAGTLTGSVTASAPFSVVSGGSFSLAGGATQSATIRFAPTAAGTFTGTANVASNDPARPSVTVPLTGTATTGPLPIGNLLANPGAEAGAASPDGTTSVDIPGWFAYEGFTVVRYGTPTFPDAKASSDIGGGQQFFYGGEQSDFSGAEQLVDVSSRAADIDAGKVTLTFNAHAGTYDDSGSDAAFVLVEALDADGGYLGSLELGPYMTADNRLAPVHGTAALPRGTRFVAVQLVALGSEGVAYVYFDNVSVTLSP